MRERNLRGSLKSPVATTVFTIVFGLGGLALAGEHTAGLAGAPEGDAGGQTQGPPEAPETGGGHGEAVSTFATTTDLTGWHKGAAIADLASRGMSQAGEHGPHAGDGGSVDDEAPDEAPEDAGSGAGSEAEPNEPAGDHPADQAGGPPA